MQGESDLIHKAQSGDMMAFTELVRQHDRAVFALIARHVNSAEDAKDVFQEVMVKVYRGLARFELRSEFATWVHRIAVNVCLSHRSRARNAQHVSINAPGDDQDSAESHVPELTSTAAGPDQEAIHTDMWRHVEGALQSLSPRERMVFSLRHYEGRPLREIAGTLGCSEGAVKRYLFDATRKMREQLQHLL
jgi:RNA polymerase sigma-70 factor (ECF subfamily)